MPVGFGEDPAWSVGPCAPLRWRTLPGNVVEIEGSGVVKAAAWTREVETWRDLIFAASDTYGVPAHWIAGIMAFESGGRVQALSPAGAIGLMELLLGTAAAMAKEEGRPVPTRADVAEPALNIALGTRYLRNCLDRNNGELPLAAVAYNAGSARCGAGCAVRDKTTKKCALPCPPNEWGLVMDCAMSKSGEWATSNYPRRVIEYANSALEHGFDLASRGGGGGASPPVPPNPLLAKSKQNAPSSLASFPVILLAGVAVGYGVYKLADSRAGQRWLARVGLAG